MQSLKTFLVGYSEIAMSTTQLVGTTEAPGYALWNSIKVESAVETLWIEREDDGLALWLVANNLTRAAERHIYHIYRGWLLQNPAILADLHLLDRAHIDCPDPLTDSPAVIRYGR